MRTSIPSTSTSRAGGSCACCTYVPIFRSIHMSRVATLALMILAASSPLRKSEVKRKPAIELQTLTGEIDAHLLKAQADSQAAPAKLIYGLAWMETRSGRSGNRARGPGIVVVDSISYYRVSAHGYLP